MYSYSEYLKEIEDRKAIGLNPKPIDEGNLLNEIISHIKDSESKLHNLSVNFFISNVLPGTTSAAGVKAEFLKEIIFGKYTIKDIPYSWECL